MIRNSSPSSGFTIFEILIAIGLFLIIGGGVYFAYANILEAITRSRLNAEVAFVIEREIEIVRNMAYEDIGVENGSPAGKLKPQKTVSSGLLQFSIESTVRNIDDPFDSVAGGVPNDTAPADYKLVEFKLTCLNCSFPINPVKTTTTAAPEGLETETKNGSLFISIVNASDQPVSGATVSIVNNSINPPILLTDTTGADGELKLVDIATSSNGYQIQISKSGYSSDKTYAMGDPDNPNPLKLHATVAKQTVTEVTFAIDKVSTINLSTKDYMCSPAINADFLLSGLKLIGTNPNTLKYSNSSSTDGNGLNSITGLEWDTYTFTNIDSDYDMAGQNLDVPLIVDPDSNIDLSWTMLPKDSDALMVTVVDNLGNRINDALVTITGPSSDSYLITGRHNAYEDDWSNGGYDSQSNGIETDNPVGQLTLVDLGGGIYSSNSQEWLISRTVDFGTPTVTLHKISWLPENQPVQTDIGSLKFQLSANNDNTTWNFSGPDGTVNTFYASSSIDIWSGLNGNRYLRYKAFMQTEDENFTPDLQEINFNFSSQCVPSGQVFINGLVDGTYNISVGKNGYTTLADTISIVSDWQEYEAVLTP